MKRTMTLLLWIALASPVFSQDVDLGLGGDASSLLNLPAPRGNTPAPRGRGGNANATAPVDRLVRLRELFSSASSPLTKEQELALTSLLNAEIPAMRKTLQERIAALQQKNPGTPPNMDELTPEIIRLNDQLLGKMANAPALKPEQQALMKKVHRDQVKSRGGFEAIKLTLEDAGAALSPEQITQMEPLLKESTGPDALAKIIKLLTPAQRAALVKK
jgi:hypothetical protein